MWSSLTMQRPKLKNAKESDPSSKHKSKLKRAKTFSDQRTKSKEKSSGTWFQNVIKWKRKPQKVENKEKEDNSDNDGHQDSYGSKESLDKIR